jgi:hypothetical protein
MDNITITEKSMSKNCDDEKKGLTWHHAENEELFICNPCHFKCSKQSNYNSHLLTAKHARLILANEKMPKNAEEKCYHCTCGKEYIHQPSLSKHKKKCKVYKGELCIPTNNENITIVQNPSTIPTEMVVELIKQNCEFKQILLEQNNKLMEYASKPTTINNNNNTHNTLNNNFNMNFFLNETCKDAMNLTDFVDSLAITFSDLEKTGKLGYEEGISQIFINGLKKLDVSKRPIHCTDSKRERLYVRDKDNWEKDQEKERIRKAIRKIANMNVNQIADWIEANPDSQDYHSKKNDQYLNIVLKSTGGSTKEEEEKRINKVITKVAKEVLIEKDQIS